MERKALGESINERFDDIDKRFDDFEKRSNKRFDDFEKRSDKRFDDLEKRFDSRFDKVDSWLKWVIGFCVGTVTISIGGVRFPTNTLCFSSH